MGSTAMLAAPLQKKKVQLQAHAGALSSCKCGRATSKQQMCSPLFIFSVCLSALQIAAYERYWAQQVQHLAVALTAIMSGQGSSSPLPDLKGLVMHEKPFYI